MQTAILGILSVAACVQNAYYWSVLPEKVATHFGANGQPDGWEDKGVASLMMLGIQLVLPWAIVGIAYATQHLPNSTINIPHREYWLAPERRDASLGRVQRSMTTFACWMSLFAFSINHLTFKANMAAKPLDMQSFGLVVILFLIGVGVFVVTLLRRFRLPADAAISRNTVS